MSFRKVVTSTTFSGFMASVAVLFALATFVHAQITIPNTFVNGKVADAVAVDANFTAVGAGALNRTGGTMTGTLTSRAVLPSADATYALGSGAARYTTGSFSGTVTASAFTGTVVTSELSGQVAIANGGTNGTAVPTAGGVMYGTGTAYAVTSAGTTGQALVSAGASAPSFQTINSVPQHAVFFFNLSSCPAGYTEYTALRGRGPVGLPSGGTLNAAVGTALSDAENRATGQHTHTATSVVSDPGHSHHIYADASGTGGGGGWFISNGPNVDVSTAVVTATTGVTVGTTNANAGSVTGTNAPYVQLLGCEKS